MATKSEMRRLFERIKVMAKKMANLDAKFHSAVNEYYGDDVDFADDDPIIDTINYGTDSISFEEFDRRMKIWATADNPRDALIATSRIDMGVD